LHFALCFRIFCLSDFLQFSAELCVCVAKYRSVTILHANVQLMMMMMMMMMKMMT